MQLVNGRIGLHALSLRVDVSIAAILDAQSQAWDTQKPQKLCKEEQCKHIASKIANMLKDAVLGGIFETS
jgi:hypothetical protein